MSRRSDVHIPLCVCLPSKCWAAHNTAARDYYRFQMTATKKWVFVVVIFLFLLAPDVDLFFHAKGGESAQIAIVSYDTNSIIIVIGSENARKILIFSRRKKPLLSSF